MVFGVLKDNKAGEYRVVSTPSEVNRIVCAGHTVLVEHDCGRMAGFSDEGYLRAGAHIVQEREVLWRRCDIVAKVKEFTREEYPLIRGGQILFGCIHPAANPEQVDALLESGCIAFAAEDSHRYGSPNCEAAGKQGVLFGLEAMRTENGGKGLLPGGIAGARRMRALILGAGTVGRAALEMLYALGASCTVMELDLGLLRALLSTYHGQIDTALCDREAIRERLPHTDMVINCVRWQKQRRDFLIDASMLSLMERGSVIVDISNDSPGAIETSHSTDSSSPCYTVNGIVHSCVANIPGSVAHTASVAYAASLLPTLLSLLNEGVLDACRHNGYLRKSLVAYRGILTHKETSTVQRRPYTSPEKALGIAHDVLDPS